MAPATVAVLLCCCALMMVKSESPCEVSCEKHSDCSEGTCCLKHVGNPPHSCCEKRPQKGDDCYTAISQEESHFTGGCPCEGLNMCVKDYPGGMDFMGHCIPFEK
uniref:U35-Theraphotoxin-Sfo1a_1 n=1 Tax=Selenotholus foelschei TaxID=1905327 RepID=A0A482ZD37_9ARAC